MAAEVCFGKEDMISSSFSCCFFFLRFVFTLVPEELPIKRLFKFEMRLLLAHQTKLSPSSCLTWIRLKSRLLKAF